MALIKEQTHQVHLRFIDVIQDYQEGTNGVPQNKVIARNGQDLEKYLAEDPVRLAISGGGMASYEVGGNEAVAQRLQPDKNGIETGK